MDEKQLKAADQMTDEELAQVVKAAKGIRKWLDDVEAEALRRLQTGEAIKGLKLGYGRAMDKWAKTPDETIHALRAIGLEPDVVIDRKLITPATFKKQLGLSLYKEAVDKGLIVKGQGKPQAQVDDSADDLDALL